MERDVEYEGGGICINGIIRTNGWMGEGREKERRGDSGEMVAWWGRMPFGKSMSYVL